MIAFPCPRCKHNVTRHENEAGSKVACPSCGQRLQVPRRPQDDNTDNLELDPAEILLHGDTPSATARMKLERAVLRFACPHCKSVLKADPAKAGTKANCPKCGMLAEVPVPKGKLLEAPEPIIEDLSAHLAPQLPPPASARNPYLMPEPPRSVPAPAPPTQPSPFRHVVFLALLLLAAVGVGVFAVSYYRSEKVSQEAEILRFKSRIQSLNSQLNLLDIEFQGAVARRDKYRASALCDEIAHKAELLAEEVDKLVVMLPSGPERDEHVGLAAAVRLTVAQRRATAAQMRNLP